MKRLLIFPLWLLTMSGMLVSAAANLTPPNILVILADDMGYSDVGCYGGEMQTPNIDRLASEGMRLTHLQNGGMCVVSRSSMMTGNYWAKMKIEFGKTPLLSEELHAAGYRTGLIGKWHLRGDPMDRGFDHFFGFMGGAGEHFSGPKNFRLDRAPFTDFGPNWYSADAYSDRAIEFIKSATAESEKKPFFLYLAYQTPHSPLEAPKADIEKIRGRYLAGWEAVRDARFKRQKEMGLVPADSELPNYPKNLPQWKSLTPAQHDLEDLRMSVFAAMIERMDKGIGRVLQALEASGQASNTLVIFMSDNGADSFSSGDQRLLQLDKLPGDAHSNWQLGTGWAYASDTPWRLYKISQHCGGVTTGAIVKWPGVAQAGRIDNSLLHFVDLMPTFLAAAGQSTANLKIAGESFLPLLKGQPWQRQEPLYFQFVDNRAIRTPEWTLAEVDGSGWELFHNPTDPFENNNLAAQKPEVVADLNARWLKWWLAESGEPNYEPKKTGDEGGYQPQGDRGSGKPYHPSAMPAKLADHYPVGAKKLSDKSVPTKSASSLSAPGKFEDEVDAAEEGQLRLFQTGANN